MASDSSTKATRQAFNVVVGWVGVVLGILLATAASFSSGRSLLMVAVALALLSYCVMVRPSIRLTSDAVVVSNVLREVTLPWEGISHARSRGSLTIVDNDEHVTTVWAIGSQKARNDSARAAEGPRSWRPVPGSLVEAPTSSRALTEAINAETVDNPAETPSGRRVRWLPVPCALVALSVVCLLTGVFA